MFKFTLFRAYPIELYPCRTKQAAAIMHMIMNNLDHQVAQVRSLVVCAMHVFF